MAEVGFFRRIAPAVVLAAAGGILLYFLPSSADNDTSSAEDLGASEGSSFPSDEPSAPDATSSPEQSASPSATSTQRVIEGDPIDFKFGTVQVKILLDGSTLQDIAVITAPGGNYTAYTNRAIPGMKAEILAAQSTKVAAVSGATYTSNAYAQSVQSALDKA